MIYQIVCDCGSAAIGELHEKDIIDTWAVEHSALCEGKFSSRMNAVFREVCPSCQITYYGESEEAAQSDLKNHYITRTDCTPVGKIN